MATGRPEVFAQRLGVADAGFQVIGLPEINEFAFGRLPVEDLTSAWLMSVLHAYSRPSYPFTERSLDIVVALAGLIVALPLLPVIVVLVKWTPGPLLYRHQRIGELGRVVTIVKFRSMRGDAEAAGGAQWAAENGPRVTKAGRVLRLLRLDELPQLLNVLRGEMSIVGPCPEWARILGTAECRRTVLDAPSPSQARGNRLGADTIRLPMRRANSAQSTSSPTTSGASDIAIRYSI